MINEYVTKKVPLDSVWMDQLLMNNSASFTIDNDNFKGLKEKVEGWHTKGISFVQTYLPQLKLNSAIHNDTVQKNLFIPDPQDAAKPFVSKGKDTGECSFIDLLTNSSWDLFKTGMENLNNSAGYKGLWIRQESPYTVCDGPCPAPVSYYESLPLQKNTIPLECQYRHSASATHYNVHGLYSLLNAIAVSKSSEERIDGEKLRVTSSVAAPRLGHYSTLWRGNVNSTWEELKRIIAETLAYNMAGISFVGYPVCGYKEVKEELCVRWYQLATYMPEMRLHHDGKSSKEPTSLPEKFLKAVKQRYRIVRFLYTKVYEAEILGGSVWEPLGFVFPHDENCYKDAVLEETFVVGRTLYVVPALAEGKAKVNAYLPNWNWYSFHDYSLVREYEKDGKGKEIELDASEEYTNVFIKGGRILPVQNEEVLNTKELLEHPVTLIVAPDHEKKAKGTMVVSEDKNFDIKNKKYNHYSFTYIHGMFRSNMIEGYTYDTLKDTELFKEIHILDKSLANVKYACALTFDLHFHELQVTSHPTHLVLSPKGDLKLYLKHIDSITFGEDASKTLCNRSTMIYIRNYDESQKSVKLGLDSSNGVKYSANFTLLSDQTLYLALEPAVGDNWRPADVLVEGTLDRRSEKMKLSDFALTIPRINEKFGFSVSTPEGKQLLATSGQFLMEGDRFMKFDFKLNGDKIYGLGERVTEFELADGIYTLFCKSQKSFVDNHKLPGKNMYGAHSFYVFHTSEDLFAGVFILTTSPVDVVIATSESAKTLSHVIGSSTLDLFFFHRARPNAVVAEYQKLIGKPVLVPYWSFGYHQCRWGYDKIEILKEVVSRFEEKGIPLDVLWNDIDYMIEYRDFTLDTARYPDMDKFLNELKAKNISYVPILDSGIARKPSYFAYEDGLKKDLFIKSAITNKPLVGVVWPGFSVFTDFTHNQADEFWVSNLNTLHKVLPFDELWLDMDEVTNFCDGECPDEVHYADKEFTTDKDDMMIYYIGHKKLNDIMVSLDAKHANGVSEYNLHNLNGFYTTRAVYKYFVQAKKRPFIITRSTFPGLGRYGSHWLGDNYSKREFMIYSISGIYNFQLFGIPFTGSDVCGFADKADLELCKHWMQLGAFYPFYRNHKEINSGEQEPYVDDDLAKISIHTINTRYTLFRYLYSQYFEISLNGGAFFTPLFWHFPGDQEAYKHNEETFLLGPNLKISPCLTPSSQDPIDSYFPNHDWYELFFSGKQVMTKNESSTIGKTVSLSCALEPNPVLNVHIAGGSVIPLNRPSGNLCKTLSNAIDLVVVPSEDMAKGGFYYDDDKADTIQNGMYQRVNVTMNKELLEFSFGEKKFEYEYGDSALGNVKIFNAAKYSAVKCAIVKFKDETEKKFEPKYNEMMKTLTVEVNAEITSIVNIIWKDGACP
eukprot:TRINITY_DN890_c0_g3_i1.p1 TRINITY_DN890_c0_g3~~TRINITY_DN890_c0_g3_i1.p1  ORF type:complete len:1399 (-),score=444.07 TRINITY_DN890_c0_g3_i1:150-4346(-)